jgi:molecular chaperone DnaJ
VALEANGDAREVACTGDAGRDAVVRVLVPLDARCPDGSEPHRDRLGLGIACLDR